MVFTPRMSQPEDKNKYYNNTSTGGYSPYNGNKKQSCYTNKLSALPNCTSYAAGRFSEIGGYGKIKYVFSGNAENWYAQAKSKGLKTGSKPKIGSIICWGGGDLNDASLCGHVAIVEQVNSDGSIVTSESGWNANKLFFTTKRTKGSNGNWGLNINTWQFQGFIYFPEEIKTQEVKTKTTKQTVEVDGCWGCSTTKATQKMFNTVEDGTVSGQLNANKQYLPACHISSWKFSTQGNKTGSNVIVSLQTMLSMTKSQRTGQCDTITVKKLQNWLKRKNLYCGKATGIMDEETVKGWQKYINQHFS